MVTTARTPEGLETRLRPRGIGRFLSAGFLGLWLCGWAIGEGLVLWLLIKGAAALLTGRPPDPGREPLEAAPALAVGLFLLVWLSLWTLGGIMAARELLRLLWSEDRIVAGVSSLDIHRRIGPFRRTISMPRPDLVRIEAVPHRGLLVVQTESGIEDLTSLGTAAERESLVTALRIEYGLDSHREAATRAATLPAGWAEEIDPEGSPVLLKDPAARRAQARFAWGATAVVSTVAAVTLRGSAAHPEWTGLAVVVGSAALLLGYGAWRLTATRSEWRLGSGRLTLRRRGGRGARDLFEATGLELARDTDSDGDVWHVLNAVGGPGGDGESAGGNPEASADRPRRRAIVRLMNDPVLPRRLGAWIAGRTGMRLDERSEPASMTWAEARARLESSGSVGRWLAARLPKV